MITSGVPRKKRIGVAQPVKKLTIKLTKSKPKVPENFEDDQWNKLRESIIAIQQKQPVSHNREELYDAVQTLCMHKLAANLFKKLEAEIDKSIAKQVEALVDQTPDQVAFLEIVISMWHDYCDQMLTIRSIFLCLDRSYVIHNVTVRSLWDLGLSLLRTHLQRLDGVEAKIIQGILQQILLDRSGETVNDSLLRGLSRMLMAIGLYESSFEPEFLVATREFYKTESNACIARMQIPEYLKHVDNRLRGEGQRVMSYLDSSTRKRVIEACETELLRAHFNTILEKGFDNLVDTDRLDDLQLMYNLFARSKGLDLLQNALAVYIKRVGMKIVQDEANDKSMVNDLLNFKQRMDAMLQKSMDSNPDYEKTLKESFEYFINSRENKPAELVAKYVDGQLRSGNKGGSEDEIEALLDQVMVLFRYIHGKDVFEAFYKKDLARRLLLSKSASYDLEKGMISKLKHECGSHFTSKLELMFKDVDLSRGLMASFETATNGKVLIKSPRARAIELQVHVLTSGFWPATPNIPEVILPSELVENQQVFSDFYLAKYQGRRLTWQHSLGHCLLRFMLDHGRKELAVSLYQSLVLLLFNPTSGTVNQGTLDFATIMEMTGIEDGELRRTLQSLACGKVRVLTKIPKGREVLDTDQFMVCKEFRHKAYRIKINSIQLKETPKQNSETHAQVQQDRQYQVDATIVRVMKARKVMAHGLLIAELYKQLKFPYETHDLKKRIESLIDREYLERDENEPNVYHYLA